MHLRFIINDVPEPAIEHQVPNDYFNYFALPNVLHFQVVQFYSLVTLSTDTKRKGNV